MKQLILVFIVATLFSCGNKQAEQPTAPKEETTVLKAPEKMNGLQLKSKYGIELSSLDYTNGTLARGKKVKADAVTLSVFTDLVLTESAGVFTTTISPNAEWGGVQKFFTIDTTNNGVSVCNWNWSYVPAPATMTCNSNGTGSYRSWTSDKITYDVHLSPFVSF